MSKRIAVLAALYLCLGAAGAQQTSSTSRVSATVRPEQHGGDFELGVLTQGGVGLTDNRNGYRFFMAGIHAGKILTNNIGPGVIRGNFEYAVELFPFWQSYTPITARQNCVQIVGPVTGSVQASCSAPFSIGGTYPGISITPILLRWNLVGSERWQPWIQGGGGVIWTNHKYPPFGGPPVSTGGVSLTPLGNNGPSSDTSVWNFTPQFGVGVHYFTRANRSVDLGANAVHISSASLGDKNPGVNASVQFTLGYTWWK